MQIDRFHALTIGALTKVSLPGFTPRTGSKHAKARAQRAAARRKKRRGR